MSSLKAVRRDCPPVAAQAHLYVRTLHRACEKLGGTAALARHLGTSEDIVKRLLDGTTPVPQPVFLRAVDVLTADDASTA